MVSHKKNIVRLMLLTLIFITILSSFQINNVLATSNITYQFNQDSLFTENNPVSDAGYNTRNRTQPTEIFNGTESYTDLVILPTSPIEHVDESNANCEVTIESSYNNHSDVLKLYDDSATGKAVCGIILYSARSTNGDVIEFWINFEGATTDVFGLRFYNTGNTYISAYIQKVATGYLQYSDGGVFHNAQIIISGAWNHIMVKFDWANKEYDLAVNGIWFLDKDYHQNSANDIKRIMVHTSTPESGHSLYIDALDISWDTAYWGWYEGRNFLPYEIVLDDIDIDNWEFGSMTDGTLPAQGETDIPFWDVDAGSPSIDIDEINYWDDYAVQMKAESTTHDTISRDFSLSDGKIYSFITIQFGAWSGAGASTHYYEINYYSYDDTLVLRLRYSGSATNKLYYYNGSTYNELFTVGGHVNHKFWIYMYEDYALVQFKVSTTYRSWTFPLLTAGKDGLGKIEFNTWASGSDSACSKFNLDRITVSQNGVSQADDFAIEYFEFPDSDYFDSEYNEFLVYDINATGTFALGVYHYYASYLIFDGVPYTTITGDYVYQSGFDSSDWMDGFWIKFRTPYSITNLTIYSYYAQSGSDKYFPIIDMGNTVYNESRFYVDGSHRLRFSLNVNDNDTEYIQLTFNIPVIETENRSISFMSNINGNSLGFFRVNYTDDTSTYLSLPHYLTTTNVILPQTRYINSLGLLITDNDITDNAVCSGYITNVQLIYITNLQVQVITLNLMMVIVPIMVILVPTFGVSARYGKSTILPMFILMSVICFATELIPMWLFFVIMLSSGAFLFMKKKGSEN